MKAIERLYKYIDYKGNKPTRFEKELGLSNGYLGTQLKRNADLGESVLNKIIDYCLDINPEWLLTGKGEMLKQDESLKSKAIKVAENSKDGIPLIPINAMAGYMTGDVQILEYECERYIVPMFRDADFLIPVKGSSMVPKYNSGDLVACKKLPLNDLFFQWNKVYVIDTAQGPIVKRVKRGEDDDHVSIVSDNKQYDAFPLHKSQIRSVALVVGVIRLE